MFIRATKRAGEAPKTKTLRESEASFHFLAETIATPIFISRGERLHYANHAAEVLTGYTRKELLSMNFWDLIPPDSRKPVGLVSRCEVRILTKNHEERWLEITVSTIDFDGLRVKLSSAFDRRISFPTPSAEPVRSAETAKALANHYGLLESFLDLNFAKHPHKDALAKEGRNILREVLGQ